MKEARDYMVQADGYHASKPPCAGGNDDKRALNIMGNWTSKVLIYSSSCAGTYVRSAHVYTAMPCHAMPLSLTWEGSLPAFPFKTANLDTAQAGIDFWLSHRPFSIMGISLSR